MATLVACDGTHIEVPDAVLLHMPVVVGIIDDLGERTVPLLDSVATGKRVQLVVDALQATADERDGAFERAMLGSFEDRAAMFELVEYLDVDALKKRAAAAVAAALVCLQSRLSPFAHEQEVQRLLTGTRTPTTALLARDQASASR